MDGQREEAASASNGERSSQPAHHRASDGLDTRIDRQVQHIGQSGEFEHRLLELSKFDGDDQSPTSRGILRRVNDHDTFLVLPGQSTSLDRDEIVLLHAIESVVAPHGPALIETFFSIVHPSFPILRAQSFLGNGKGSAQETAPPALLGAIYILSLGWWSHKSEEDRLIRPDMNELKRLTSRSLDIAVHRPRLSTIQAGLLLLQVSDQDSWPLTAQLVAIGQGLGLHLDSSNWRISQEERALRRRLAWALFMQDKWSALIHGRPSHIVQSSWSVKPVTDEDFADIIVQQDREDSNNDEKEKSMMLFGHMIPLTEILSDVLDTFYTLQAIDEIENAGSNGTKMILERAKPIQIKLKDWFARLPACLRMDSITPNQLSSTGYLHLAYFATEITLHRRIVRSLNPGATDAYLMHICRSAAKTRLISAMDFINRMKPEHLQSFWYFSSKISFALIGTFGGLLLATAPSKEEAEFYRRRLSEYRWTLTVSSKSASFMRFAVEMLDTSTGFLENLEKKPSISWQQTNMAGSIANDEAMMDAPHFHLFSESGKPDPMDHLLLDPPSGASGLASPSTSTSSRFSEQDGYPAPMKGFELRRAQEETFDFFARPGS
ncbi:MAG: Fungal specific transcription factor [Sclerophora amabilis]|nr:MAG: Fungal specific transcription factor [Sclerophora amabilis]